jgi:hypothetical protein
MIAEEIDLTLHLPRILCLHGGGTNARIFRAQCRVLRAHLHTKFRLCFADAPFLTKAHHPDVALAYKNFGTLRRWLRWMPDHPEIDAGLAIKAIEKSLDAAMKEDDEKGATGEWVGLLGFSQGAKICASLMFRQQVRAEKKLEKRRGDSNYRFAILMAGRGPLVSLDPEPVMTPWLCDASQLSLLACPLENVAGREEHILRLPTIHVHGLRDQGLAFHRQLLEQYCEKGNTRLVEWDGDHRVPIKRDQVSAIVEQILDIAKETGVSSE